MAVSDRLHRSRTSRGSLIGAAMAIFAIAILGATVYFVHRYLAESAAQSAAEVARQKRPLDPAVPTAPLLIGGPPPDVPAQRGSLFDNDQPPEDGRLTVDSALQRVAAQLRDAVQVRPTLVIWLFDRSASAAEQRNRIAGQFESLYQEFAGAGHLGRADGAAESARLLSAIAAFGKDVEFLTPEPMADVGSLAGNVAALSTDDTGVENTFAAIQAAAERHLALRTEGGRHVMIVVVTDEVGDDQQRIEPALAVLRRNSIPVYIIGVSAPFGQREAADAEEGTEPTPVVQGPESLEPELIQLDFVNAGPGVWSSGSAAAGESIDSGIGPYSLSRLCRDAGGEYFAVPVSFSGAETLFGGTSAVGGTTYDRAVLRRYAPLYLPEEGYRKLTAENKALAALVEAARLPRVDPRFDWPSEFMPSEENRFRRALDEAQQPPARLMPRIDKLYETLKAGESDRDRLTEPRWQAGYDLAMGRAMAAKVRTESFIAMLAVMKQGKSFADPKSTAWMIERADEISVGSALDRLRQRAGECLQRVAREHPGTPWADLAKRELSVPMGWRWGEK